MSDQAVSLKKLARNRRFDELETSLLEAIEDGAVEREDVVAILNLASHRGESDELDSLLWLAVSSWGEKHGPAEAVALAREAAPLCPGAKSVREDLAGFFPAAYPDYPGVGTLAGRLFLDGERPLPEAFARVDAVLALAPGTFVLPKNDKVPSRVKGLAEDGSGLLLEGREGEVAFDVESIERLARLAEDDYRALAVFEPERFREILDERPAWLVETVLRLAGPRLTYRDLRAHLVDLLPMPWTEWWNGARPRLRRSPWIDMGASNQPTLELRRVPISHDEEIREELAGAASGNEAIAIVLDFLDESGEHAASETELLAHFVAALAKRAAGDDAPVALAALAVIEEIRQLAPAALQGIDLPPPPSDRSPADLMAPLGSARVEESVLDYVAEHMPESRADFLESCLPVLTPESCQRAADELAAAGRTDALVAASREVMTSPRRYPGALVWLFRVVSRGELPVDQGGPDRGQLVGHMVSSMDRASRGEGGRGPLYSLLQSGVTAQNWAPTRRILKDATLEGARHVLEVVERSHSLTDHVKVRLQDLLAEAHPNVFVKEVPPWTREDVIYTTGPGHRRKREEYAKLVGEKLPEIARAIGRAAAFGDLSENAEYTAALEERERLTERANALKKDLDLAVEIPAGFAEGATVTVGSRVRARQMETGEERTFLFLGPWDVDLPNGVYSYRAPLSQAFMGKRPGDGVKVQADRTEQSWEILAVEPGV